MIKRILFKVSTDFAGLIFNKSRKFRLKVFSFLSTKYMYFLLALMNVKIGKKCIFYGRPIIKRDFNSKIIIDEKCSFRSDKKSNLIGLNRKCILATFGEGSLIQIGCNSGFSAAVIGAANKITIGENVLVGANVLITDFDWHPIDPQKRRSSVGIKNAPVKIGNNVWLGINSVVLKGVSIGENTVIGANSVVVSDIPANVIAAGNPCRVIRSL